MTTTVMRGFPPEMPNQVTLANWRLPPFNRWAFHHVSEIVPSAIIPAEPRHVLPLETAFGSLDKVSFADAEDREWALGDYLTASHTDALVVLQRGRLVHEWYDSGCAPRSRHIIFSVSKSLTGTLAGIAVDRAQLDPDAPVTQYVPEAEGFAYGDCTVRHVLDMTVSIDFDESYLAAQGPFLRYRQAMNWNPAPAGEEPPDLRSFLVTLPKGAGEHGEVFHYVSPNSDMLGWVIERATGRRFANLFAEEVWQKLGAACDAYVTVDRLGAPRTAGGVCVTARDLALFGEMMRRRGTINGRQVVPGWWIDDIMVEGDRDAWAKGDSSQSIQGGSYRSKWYKMNDGRGAFFGLGVHGQCVYVDRASEAVVVKMSSQPEPSDADAEGALVAACGAIARSLG